MVQHNSTPYSIYHTWHCYTAFSQKLDQTKILTTSHYGVKLNHILSQMAFSIFVGVQLGIQSITRFKARVSASMISQAKLGPVRNNSKQANLNSPNIANCLGSFHNIQQYHILFIQLLLESDQGNEKNVFMFKYNSPFPQEQL